MKIQIFINWCPKQLCFTHTPHHVSNATSELRWHWLLIKRKLNLLAIDLKKTNFFVCSLIYTRLIKSKLFHAFSSNIIQRGLDWGYFRGRLACVEKRISFHWEFSHSDKESRPVEQVKLPTHSYEQYHKTFSEKSEHNGGLDKRAHVVFQFSSTTNLISKRLNVNKRNVLTKRCLFDFSQCIQMFWNFILKITNVWWKFTKY